MNQRKLFSIVLELALDQLVVLKIKNVYPGRGQVVVIKAPHIMENVLSWGDREPTYIIKRPYSNDQLILGVIFKKMIGQQQL